MGVCTIPTGTASGTCAAPTCTDLTQNGGESGIDCGGTSTCARCGIGASCTLDSDCNSGGCTVPAGATSGVCGLGTGSVGVVQLRAAGALTGTSNPASN